MSDYTYEQREAIRSYVVDNVSLVLENNECAYERLQRVACEAVVNDMGTGMTFDDYDKARHGRGQTTEEEYARVVGSAVRDEVREILEEAMPNEGNLGRAVLFEVLDLADSGQADVFGRYWLPDVGDVKPYFPDEDNEDD